MLRGSSTAKVDEKGRIKLPNHFRSEIEQEHGIEFYVTSLSGDCARVYPLAVWSEIEERIAALPMANVHRNRFLRNTSYYGQTVSLDNQGRILIPPLLRETAQIREDVSIMGTLRYLEIWNVEVLRKKMTEDPLTEIDEQALSQLGI